MIIIRDMKQYRFIRRGSWGVIQKLTKRTWGQKLFTFDWSTKYYYKDFALSNKSDWHEDMFNTHYKDIEL
jgi:hypothetical protein